MMIFRQPEERYRALVPARWQPPSQARGLKVAFRITARLHDGDPWWSGWFEDREDADAFLWAAVSGVMTPDIRRLPTPWFPDGREIPALSYEFLTFNSLTSPTGSNQNYNVPKDFGGNVKECHAIGAGASG